MGCVGQCEFRVCSEDEGLDTTSSSCPTAASDPTVPVPRDCCSDGGRCQRASASGSALATERSVLRPRGGGPAPGASVSVIKPQHQAQAWRTPRRFRRTRPGPGVRPGRTFGPDLTSESVRRTRTLPEDNSKRQVRSGQVYYSAEV